jgi:predicted TIM-barrel fold metal-dependent hydrolase
MNSKRRLVRTTPNHAFESGRVHTIIIIEASATSERCLLMKRTICDLAHGSLLAVMVLSLSSALFAAELTETKNDAAVTIIDTHTHLIRGYRRRGPSPTGAQALRAMDSHKVAMAILLPPPFPPNHPGIYGFREIEPVVRANPERFGFAAGGESLNPMIQQIAPDKVTPQVIRQFQQEADAIVKAGAAGFGELTAEHFSSGRANHPYESTRPDHPLFLALANIAAQRDMPIDLHMEAVPQDMPFPRPSGRGQNPETLRENISGLERLLEHNRNARIIWAHAGWDLTGQRSVPLMRSLLNKHPNLYIGIKLHESGSRQTFPFGPDGTLKPDWLTMLRDFRDRFVIGSDQFFDEGTDRLTLARKFVDALPPEVARVVGTENARRIYRFEAKAR